MFTGAFISWVSCDVEGINAAPNKPSTPQGNQQGNVSEIYTFSTSTIDTDDHNVSYQFDWDDTRSEWSEYLPSGEIFTLSHSWDTEDDYRIKVRAMDEHGATSRWSESVEISIIKTKTKTYHFIDVLTSILKAFFPCLLYQFESFL